MVTRLEFFTLEQPQKSRSIMLDRPRFFRLEGKTGLVAELHKTDLDLWDCFRGWLWWWLRGIGGTLSYNQRNLAVSKGSADRMFTVFVSMTIK